MIEIIDALPSRKQYTRFEFEVATTLAKVLYKNYKRETVMFRNLKDVKIIFKRCLISGRFPCGGLTFPDNTGKEADRIELSMRMLRSGYRIKKTVLHEMCHVHRWSEEKPKTPHGQVWKKNTVDAVKELKNRNELINVTSMPAEPDILSYAPPKFIYKCKSCLKFTMDPYNCRCGNEDVKQKILMPLAEKNNKVDYTAKGAQQKLFIRYYIWKETKREKQLSGKKKEAPVTSEMSENAISKSRNIMQTVECKWNDMNKEAKQNFGEDLLERLMGEKNKKYFNELLW